MLKALDIKNYALIDHLSVGFDTGLSVITGETGAGKSILLGALALILGKRADLNVLKNPAKKCVVEGVFDISGLALKPFFLNHDLDYDDTAIIRREISASGKSRAFVNDTPVNLQTLSSLGLMLVDIHSQHQTLMLAGNRFQLETLDGFFRLGASVSTYANTFETYKKLSDRLKELEEQETTLRRDEDYIRFQLDELSKANLDEGAVKTMEERLLLLSNMEEVTSTLSQTVYALYEQDNNVLDQLAQLREKLEGAGSFYSQAANFAERMESVRLELKDIAEEADRLRAEMELNPAETAALTEKLDELYRLQQKHQVTDVEGLLAVKEKYESRLQGLDHLEGEISEVKKSLKILLQKVEQQASLLSDQRRKGAPRLAAEVQNLLKKLGMKDAAFDVNIETLDDYTVTGKDKVTFLFSANKGIKPGEVAKVASGGELSRLMLAIKSLITEQSLLPTVVFDEIDAGVSGDIAGKVGNIMRRMAENHQLIVITHLPQIAAKADHHYKVYKALENGETKTNIRLLTREERVNEIAVMLSDETVTAEAKAAARALLK